MYGSTNSGKTSVAYLFVKEYFEKTGKRCRWLTTDGGGKRPLEDSGLIDMGIIEHADISASSNLILSTSSKIADGMWFQDDDGSLRPAKWNDIGVVVIDGITGLAELYMRQMASSNDKIAFKRGMEYEEEGYMYASLAEGHYGLAQRAIERFICSIAQLPVDWIIFTGIPGPGKDVEGTKEYGIALAGKAANVSILKQFQDIFHIEPKVLQLENGDTRDVRVAWYRPHTASNGIDYHCKARFLPDKYDLLENHPKFKKGYVPLNPKVGLKTYFDFCEKVSGDSKEENKKWAEEVMKRHGIKSLPVRAKVLNEHSKVEDKSKRGKVSSSSDLIVSGDEMSL